MATVVIGSGIGGLATAIALAARGEPVVVLESQAGAGGKLLPVRLGTEAFDSGPTVLTMRWVFDDLFNQSGGNLDEHLTLEPLHTLARHFWSGGAALDLFADQEETFDAIGHFAGKGELEGYKAFAAQAKRIHQNLLQPFMKSQRPSLLGLTRSLPLSQLFSINPFETLWSALGGYFKDPRLQQLFGRYATYCGSSPFKAPATLMLVADVEASGVWRVAGGMASLARALERHARQLGVVFHFSSRAERIELSGSAITSVIDEHGISHFCNNVIVNADSAAVAAGLFGDPVRQVTTTLRKQERSLSAFTWCTKTHNDSIALDHHNVFFSDGYAKEFTELADGPAQDPTVYICNQGEGRKLILVNAPSNAEAAPEDLNQNMMARLAKSGFNIKMQSEVTLSRSPKDFATLYPATLGALYGRASHGWLSTFKRPQARTNIPGLYLAGGSTHPGPGVPMAALAGMLAAEALLQDRALT